MSLIAASLLICGIAMAQDRPSFEGRFSATNVTVGRLIEVAYDLKDFQLSGGPGWIGSDRFDINATAAAQVSTDGLTLMLQSLLADRFNLVAHKETRGWRTRRRRYPSPVNRRSGNRTIDDVERRYSTKATYRAVVSANRLQATLRIA
jgi:hypothetical protein